MLVKRVAEKLCTQNSSVRYKMRKMNLNVFRVMNLGISAKIVYTHVRNLEREDMRKRTVQKIMNHEKEI